MSKSLSVPAIAVLIKTHFLSESLFEQISAIKHALRSFLGVDICLSLDLSAEQPESLADLSKRLPGVMFHGFGKDFYLQQGFGIHPRLQHSKEPINWFHSDYSLLDFYLRTKGRYQGYWQIEYDVSLQKGSWDFLAHDWDMDFMASRLKIQYEAHQKYVQTPCLVKPQWPWWESMRGALPLVGCFFPCIWLSESAAECLVKAYRRGVIGYCELSAPSILAAEGAKMAGLSWIDQPELEIYHPHWHKQLKNIPGAGFILNASCLDADT